MVDEKAEDGVNVPYGLYIDIHDSTAAPGMHYSTNTSDLIIGVRKALDAGRHCPVEHVVHAGNFVVEGAREMTVGDFIDQIKAGLRAYADGGLDGR